VKTGPIASIGSCRRLAALSHQPMPGVIDEDSPHGFGGGAKEMTTAVPGGLSLFRAEQAEPGLVDQGGRLQCLSGPIVGHLCGRQSAQLLVQQRQQVLRRLGLTPLNTIEQPCHLAHGIFWTTSQDPRLT
jgi:hypothetical protein